MTATPSDPLATQHDSTPDRNDQTPADAQRLLEENRALRELLAAQVSAQLPRPPGPLRRLAWWLISAPGATLVRWRSLLGREDAPPITGRRVGWATLTTLYTLAIYGALVLLVVLSTPIRSAPARRPPAPCGCRYSPCSCQAWDRNMPTAPRKNPATRRSASRRRPRPPPRHQHPQSMHRRARRMPTRRRLRPLPRSRPSRPRRPRPSPLSGSPKSPPNRATAGWTH